MVIGEVTEFTEKIQPLVCEGKYMQRRKERSPGNSKTLHVLSAFIAAAILNILSKFCQIHV